MPGGRGLFAWATTLMRATQGRRPPAQQRAAAATPRPPRPSRSGTAADRRRRQHALPRRPGSAAPACAGVLFHELFGSREIAHAATRWPTPRASAPSAVADWPGGASATSRAPHAPYSVGPELLARIFAAAAARRARRPRSTSPRTRTSSRCSATARAAGRPLLAGDGRRSRRRACRASRRSPTSRRWARSRPRRRRCSSTWSTPAPRIAASPREAGATVVLCPRSNLHIGGRLPDVDAPGRRRRARSRSAPTAWRPCPTCPCGRRWRRWPRTSRPCRRTRWLDAATRGGARALGLRGSARSPPARAPACWTCWSRTSPRRSSRWSAIRPDPALGGRAVSPDPRPRRDRRRRS